MPCKFEIGVKAVIKNKKSNKVLFLTSKDNHGDEILTFPGGRMEENENIEQALSREITEEIKNIHHIKTIKILGANPRSFPLDNGCYLMLITVLVETDIDSPEINEEHLRYFWLGADDLNKKVPYTIDGAILDNEDYKNAALTALEIE